jgi:hypothetical protein
MLTPQQLFGVTMEMLRKRVGLVETDTSQDELIEASWIGATGLIEEYTDRWLVYGTYTEVITHFTGLTFPVKAFPISAVNFVRGDNTSDIAYHANKQTGVVYLDAYAAEHELSIEYDGGYQALPAAIMAVLLPTFDAVFASLGSSGGTSSAGKEIKSVTLDSVGTVSYFNSADASGSGESFGLIPSNLIGMLTPFIRYKC